MICLNKRYRMTADSEKVFVELGGYDSNKTLSESELSNALCKAFTTLADHGRFDILEKIYLAVAKHRDMPR